MKQFITVAIASIVLLIGSCGPKEQYYYVSYTIFNQSDHKIGIFIFKHNNTIDTMMLPICGSDTVIDTRQEGRASDPPPFVTDSVKVTYDDTISIVHYRTALQDASRSILIEQSWNGPSIDGLDYAWEYLFTNDDYEEAVLLQ